jgi:predicted HicB family RNase H-like nuclease
MELTPYVEALRAQLSAAGGIGGPETVAVAERLGDTLESAARLAIQQAICDAAEQITRDLAPGAVEVRLRAQELDFVTTLPTPLDRDVAMAPVQVTATSPARGDAVESAESGTARISFRPSEQLKARIEEAAERAGQSVNAFLVTTLTTALDAPVPLPAPPTRGGTVTGWFA